MKIKNIKTKPPVFKPYSETLEITIESKNDEILLIKLKQLADEEELCLCTSDGEELVDIYSFSRKEDTDANELVRDIFANLK